MFVARPDQTLEFILESILFRGKKYSDTIDDILVFIAFLCDLKKKTNTNIKLSHILER